MKNDNSTSLQTLEDVKTFFHDSPLPRRVWAWNELRETAKEKFGHILVSQLDASGYITAWLNQNKVEDYWLEREIQN